MWDSFQSALADTKKQKQYINFKTFSVCFGKRNGYAWNKSISYIMIGKEYMKPNHNKIKKYID